MSRYTFLLLVSLLASFAVPLLLGGGEALRGLLHTPWSVIAAGVVLSVVSWLLNAVRSYVLLHGLGLPLGFGRAVAVTVGTECLGRATPAGAGAPVAFALLLRPCGVNSARAGALFALDQFIDLILFTLLLPVIVLLALRDAEHLLPVWIVLGSGLSLGVGVALALLVGWHHRRVLRWTGGLLGRLRVADARRWRLGRWSLRFRDTLRAIGRLPRWRLALVMAACCAQWLVRYSILFVVIIGLGGHVPWPQLFLVQMAALGIGQATMLPGGSGGTEASVSLLLAPWLPSGTLAAAILAWRLLTFHGYLLIGAPVFFWLWRRGLVGPAAAPLAAVARTS